MRKFTDDEKDHVRSTEPADDGVDRPAGFGTLDGGDGDERP